MGSDRVVEKLDRFELISELASGGMATVFLARLGGVGGFQRLYAIKRLHPHLARDGEFIQMFMDEARLAARIHHPNVVPIHEIGITESGYYLVMEYIEGDTAARLFARSAQAGTKLPVGVGLRIMLDAIAGLHAAHELKDDGGKPLEIVHRDVSPQNILVGVDGVARITDFGVARAATRLSTTRTGQLKGKLAYMAPEQARSGKIDRRADVFAMGICIWEALAFRRLFKSEGEAETLNRVLYDPIPVLQSVVPTIPSALNSVVMKALERDPDKRFASAAELGDALEKAALSVKSLGTARDVIACMDGVMGTELSQQREAVRAWLARSEPSRNDSPGPIPASRPQGAAASVPPPPKHAESVTRVERSPSTMPPPPAVSSVSSAVLHVPPPESPESTGAIGALDTAASEGSSTRPSLFRRRRRLGMWGAALMLTALVLGGGAVTWRRAALRASASRAPSLSNVSHAPAALVSAAPGAATVSSVEGASAQPLATAAKDGGAGAIAASSEGSAPSPARAGGPGTAAMASTATSPVARPRRPRPQAAPATSVKPETPDPAAPAATVTVPDDITHNPYR